MNKLVTVLEILKRHLKDLDFKINIGSELIVSNVDQNLKASFIKK